ncbi:ABC transporter permease [Anaerosoma tenue]|nr:ABC transporter permease [Anaerosoma tenue]MCK8115822.1 ABC transporter permease [Anaerosoma tenue]
MSRPTSRPAIIRALLKKELTAYSRDLVFLGLTLVVLIAAPFLFHALPDSVDESITLGVYPAIPEMIGDAREALAEMGATEEQLAELDDIDLAAGEEGLALIEFESEERLRGVIEGSLELWRTESGEMVYRDKEAGDKKPEDAERVEPDIGVAFPSDFIAGVAAGKDDLTVTVYSQAGIGEEIQTAMKSFVREAAYQIAGRELPVGMPDEDTIVLGDDRMGDQVTMQERMRPLLLFMVLLMETFSMASLVSTEVLQRTVTAVLVTPAKVGDFLAAKTIFGTLMSLSQALIILVFIGGVTSANWSLILTVLVMGAIMFTGIALFVGAAGKDFMGQLFYAMLFTIPLLIPAISVMFPGSAAPWVKALPSYPIIKVLVDTTAYGGTWGDAWGSLAYAALWLVVLYFAGLFALKRKVETL